MTSLIDANAIRPGPRQIALALVLAAAAMAPLLPGGFRPLDVRAQLVLAVTSVTLLSLAALRLITTLPEATHGIARWRVGPWFLLWGGFAFGFASVTWLGPQTGSATRIALTSVVDALAVFGVAIVVWTAGYVAGAPRWLRSGASWGRAWLLGGAAPVVRGGAMPWALYGIGTAARLASVALTGHLGYVGDPSTLVSEAAPYRHLLTMTSNLAVFAIAAAAYRAFSSATRGGAVTLWILVGVEATVGALSGGKQSFVLSVLAVLIPYGAVRGRLSLRILLAGAVLFLWIVVPFNSAYRQVVRTDESTLSPSAAVAAAPGVLSGVARSDPGVAVVKSSTALLYRVREIDSVAIITQRTPSTIPYRSPWEYAAAPVVGVVPRAVWPEKPILASGYEFSQEYYGLPSNVYTSTAITPVGDLYRHGGWLVVVGGMLLLGMVCRLFDSLFRPESDPRAVCFVLVFLPMLVKSEMDVYSMIASLPSGILTAAVGARLMCRSARTGPGNAHG